MIPRAYITEWRNTVGWQSDAQIEQDLIICRALVEIFSDKVLAENLAFRGGTALHKLHLGEQLRYSEDIDLVQVKAGAIGPLIDRLRDRMTFLGKPRVKQSGFNNTIVFSYETEIAPVATMKLKVEINCREHFAVYGYKKLPFSVSSKWFGGECSITTFEVDELLGTKTRALYQRKKGRDLFDLYYALTKAKSDPKKIIKAFNKYMESEGGKISQKQFIHKHIDERLLKCEVLLKLDNSSTDDNKVCEMIVSGDKKRLFASSRNKTFEESVTQVIHALEKQLEEKRIAPRGNGEKIEMHTDHTQ